MAKHPSNSTKGEIVKILIKTYIYEFLILFFILTGIGAVRAAAVEPVLAAAKKEKTVLLDTLSEIVSI